MNVKSEIQPFENCLPLDGYHCQTNSLAKIYHYYNNPLSEEMLFGLGAGLGFIYWKMKMEAGYYVFIGGRGNNKDFFSDIGKRTGVEINSVSTASAKKAETALMQKLVNKEPFMVFGDMAYLPWFDFPDDYHFGGHTFVICGYDGESTVLASDIDPNSIGLKKGFFHPINLEQLKTARGSKHKPFPAKNTYLEFDFSKYHSPGTPDIYDSIKQTADSMLNPPIKNLGVKGIRHTSKELLKWPDLFDEQELLMNLFNLYIFIEVGGTGGGSFRYMYSRFLKESARLTENDKLLGPAEKLQKAGVLFTKVGLLFKDPDLKEGLQDRIKTAGSLYIEIADMEEEAYKELTDITEMYDS